jgi:predicted aspartyl protease
MNTPDQYDHTVIDRHPTPLGFRLDNNLIVVDALINDSEVKMILDTGAGATLVSHDVVDRLELQQSGDACDAAGAGGDLKMDLVEADSLGVGPVTLFNVTLMAMDLAPIISRLEERVDGVIGFNFLSNLHLSIRYPEQTLLLEQTLP